MVLLFSFSLYLQIFSTLSGLNFCCFVNCLPYDKILDWSKLKAFADEKINVTQELKFVSGRKENIVGKGENAGYQKISF